MNTETRDLFVSGNDIYRSCFRIPALNSNGLSADVHRRYGAIEGGCYSVGYSPALPDHLDANYGHDPGRDQTVQPSSRVDACSRWP